MGEFERARNLISAGKYDEAGRLLNRLISEDRENDRLWYLLAILAVKLKNHETAQEYLERAVSLSKKPEYLWLRGMAYMELLEIDEAIRAFRELLEVNPSSVEGNFFLAVCYLLVDDPQSERFMKKAYSLDKKKTRQLLGNFFEAFVSKSPETRRTLKAKIEKELASL
ncbi:tetratricopeptide repeat protein [Candidatus Micrarchaeota archaeon]|nr:tetratricopeptide repeat protein [Candidatus Micrarchaeota archaeon]